jgi:hypothetical protein
MVHPDNDAEIFDDGGARGQMNRLIDEKREALATAERRGIGHGTPAWHEVAAPHDVKLRRLAESLEARAPRDAKDAEALATSAVAVPTPRDPMHDTRRREIREKVLRTYPDPSLRQLALVSAARRNEPEDRELLEAVLSEPGPRELQTDEQREELQATLVHRRVPAAVQAAYRAKRARDRRMSTSPRGTARSPTPPRCLPPSSGTAPAAVDRGTCRPIRRCPPQMRAGWLATSSRSASAEPGSRRLASGRRSGPRTIYRCGAS